MNSLIFRTTLRYVFLAIVFYVFLFRDFESVLYGSVFLSAIKFIFFLVAGLMIHMFSRRIGKAAESVEAVSIAISISLIYGLISLIKIVLEQMQVPGSEFYSKVGLVLMSIVIGFMTIREMEPAKRKENIFWIILITVVLILMCVF